MHLSINEKALNLAKQYMTIPNEDKYNKTLLKMYIILQQKMNQKGPKQ